MIVVCRLAVPNNRLKTHKIVEKLATSSLKYSIHVPHCVYYQIRFDFRGDAYQSYSAGESSIHSLALGPPSTWTREKETARLAWKLRCSGEALQTQTQTQNAKRKAQNAKRKHKHKTSRKTQNTNAKRNKCSNFLLINANVLLKHGPAQKKRTLLLQTTSNLHFTSPALLKHKT